MASNSNEKETMTQAFSGEVGPKSVKSFFYKV